MMFRLAIMSGLAFITLSGSAHAQNLTGVWLNSTLASAPYTDPVPLNRTDPPLKPEHLPAYEEILKAQREATAAGKPLRQQDDTCTPVGMPTMMQGTHPLEILETPGRITIIGEIFNEIRRVSL